jgi:CMP-N-acetylneuraminic acid synthetase
MSRPSILAVVPISGADADSSAGMPTLAGRSLLDYTLDSIRGSAHLDRVIVSTDSEVIAADARRAGVDMPFLRPPSLANPRASVSEVVRHTLTWLDGHQDYRPAWVVLLMVTYPFRPAGFVDRFIETVLGENLDSAFAAVEERHSLWMLNDLNEPELVSSGSETPKAKKRPLYRELTGLITMTTRDVALDGRLYGERVGIVPTADMWAGINVHDPMGRALAETLAPEFERSKERHV